MGSEKPTFLKKDFLIPFEIKVNPLDLKKNTNTMYDISYSGSLVPKEYFLNEFKEDSKIFKYGKKILKEINCDKYDLLYIPNKEWYSIFRVIKKI